MNIMAATTATTSKTKPDSSFTVTSGALCFGNRREVGVGAASPIQAPIFNPNFEAGGGTVLSHAWKYNLSAVNGRWDVYLLVHVASNGGRSGGSSGSVGGRVVAAFVCHESITDSGAYAECSRILSVANAPWEEDEGTRRNTQRTWDERVLVVNRYDWDEDYYGEEEDGIDDGEEELVGGGQRNSRYLIDRDVAKNEPVDAWCEDRGVRLVIFGEYIYGRFGLVDDGSAVHSFLLFTGDTTLAQTAFRGEERCVYVPLTLEERHAKRLADGNYYTGYEWLRTACRKGVPQRLANAFGADIISYHDAEDVLRSAHPTVPIIEPQLREDVMQIINEALAVWIVSLKFAAETSSCRDDFFKAAFPAANRPGVSIDSMVVKEIHKDNCSSISVLQDSIDRIFGDRNHSLCEYLSVKELSCAVRCIVGEVVELAGNCARDNKRSVLVPSDVRIAIINDRELCEKGFNGSITFWPPDVGEWTMEDEGAD